MIEHALDQLPAVSLGDRGEPFDCAARETRINAVFQVFLRGPNSQRNASLRLVFAWIVVSVVRIGNILLESRGIKSNYFDWRKVISFKRRKTPKNYLPQVLCQQITAHKPPQKTPIGTLPDLRRAYQKPHLVKVNGKTRKMPPGTTEDVAIGLIEKVDTRPIREVQGFNPPCIVAGENRNRRF